MCNSPMALSMPRGTDCSQPHIGRRNGGTHASRRLNSIMPSGAVGANQNGISSSRFLSKPPLPLELELPLLEPPRLGSEEP